MLLPRTNRSHRQKETDMTDTTNKPICPGCGGYIPNNDTPGLYPGALSRKDNKTMVCSACGTAEAMDDFAASLERSR